MGKECEPIQSTEANAEDIFQLSVLQNEFDTAMGTSSCEEDLLKRSYNVVVDRWHIEGLRGDQQKLQEHLAEVRENLKTNLMERMHAVESYGKFLIQDEKLYSELFPNESMGQILLRGANVRAAHGSLEKEREGLLGELTGWKMINDTLVHADIGTKIISLSPPGRVEGTSYYGKFVDSYEVVEEHGKKMIKRARIAVDFDDEGYRNTALMLDPKFFDDYDGRPLDAWYLSHPVPVTGLEELAISTQGMSADKFAEIYQACEQQGLIEYYLQVISAEQIDWREVARAFNTILTVADRLSDGQTMDQISRQTNERRPEKNTGDTALQAMVLVHMLGEQKVQEVGGGGCPPNKGIDFANPTAQLTNEYAVKKLLENSVGQWGMSEKETWSYHRGECRICAEKKNDHATKDVGPCEICKECEKTF